MTDYLTFEGTVEPMEWGNSTFTVLRLPDEIAEALKSAGVKRVEGEIADHPVNLAPTTAPAIDGMFLWTGKSLLKRIGIVPGERVEVRLRPADANAVETPDDVTRALLSSGQLDSWEALTPGKKRGLIHQIESAKKPETRARRITKLMKDLDPNDD